MDSFLGKCWKYRWNYRFCHILSVNPFAFDNPVAVVCVLEISPNIQWWGVGCRGYMRWRPYITHCTNPLQYNGEETFCSCVTKFSFCLLSGAGSLMRTDCNQDQVAAVVPLIARSFILSNVTTPTLVICTVMPPHPPVALSSMCTFGESNCNVASLLASR